MHGLPQTAPELFDWATTAKNRHVIPEALRSDCNPILASQGEQTQEDPEALARLVNQTFEGRAWVCSQLEKSIHSLVPAEAVPGPGRGGLCGRTG